VIAVQVLNYFDKGGIAGYKDTTRHIAVYPKGKENEKISLVKKWKYFIQDIEPPATPRYQADYQPFGDIWLHFKNQTAVTNYRRELDITNAIAKTTYTINEVDYTREYFASQPEQVIAIHLTSSKPGSISFECLFNSPHQYSFTQKSDDKTLALSVKVKYGALKGESFLKVQTKNGKAIVQGNKIIVNSADEVTLYLTAATNYKNYKDVSANPVAICKKAIDNVNGKSYDQIKFVSIKEYQKYFNTLSVDFGSNVNSKLPTDERIARFASSSDPSLVALYMQYGRYLLISSSRPGTRPANLQGIWNDLLTPPWGSKYTTNINLEMNYWPSELLNLSPMQEPLFNMIDELAQSGQETAKEYYNVPGWVLHHNTDVWRGTAPINASNHGIWVGGSGWLSHHLWEHYLFTQDKNFLKNSAYPIMKQSALFYNSYLVKDPKTGWLISGPSNSPEQGGLVMGPAMDHEIIRSLFKAVIEASEILSVDKNFRDTLQQRLPLIAPNQIGKYGQLREWLQDVDDTSNKHRHVSHLWAVYPGNEINWDEAGDFMKAARQSLIYRGDAATGWSLAWKINLWARFKDGDHTYKLLQMLLSPAEKFGEGSYHNLFDAHPPFQIDGNFGGAAGIGEMLVQSHTKYIDLLPALPAALHDGEIKGICARGGFQLNLQWKDGKLQAVDVFSLAGKDCLLRYNGKTRLIKTRKGKTYKLNGDLQFL
jgi:alpha-L-fucosidase 2